MLLIGMRLTVTVMLLLLSAARINGATAKTVSADPIPPAVMHGWIGRGERGASAAAIGAGQVFARPAFLGRKK